MMKNHNQSRENEFASDHCDFVMERFGNLKDADRSFDVEFWQR